MRCEHCGTIFCWDIGTEVTLGGGRKTFCSRTCARAASASGKRHSLDRSRRRSREQARLAACDRMGKIRYEDVGAARAAAAWYSRERGRSYPYECPCGGWHLTKAPP